MLVRINLWLPRPHNTIGHWSGRIQVFSREAAAGPGKRYDDAPGSIPSDNVPLLDTRGMVMFQVLCLVIMHGFWTTGEWCFKTLVLVPHGERALASVSVQSRDVSTADASPVS